MRVIGVTGFSGVGKDVVADAILGHVQARRNITTRKLGFSDLLMATATEMGWDGSREGEGRILLQDLGKALRTVKHDGLICAVDRKLDLARHDGCALAVVTGVRFAAEGEFLAGDDWMARIIRVDRPEYGPVNMDLTELGVDHVHHDVHIYNDGTLRVLQAKALDAYYELEALDVF